MGIKEILVDFLEVSRMTAIDLRLIIHTLKILAIIMGGIISFRSTSAYFREKGRDLGLFALGFVLLTTGIILSELLSFIIGDLLFLILTETLLVLGGFVSMFMSFYVKISHSYLIPHDTQIILGDDRYGFTLDEMTDLEGYNDSNVVSPQK